MHQSKLRNWARFLHNSVAYFDAYKIRKSVDGGEMEIPRDLAIERRQRSGYEATITDPKLFTRPWKLNVVLYKHLERNFQLLEFKCVEFAEEMLYGHLRQRY